MGCTKRPLVLLNAAAGTLSKSTQRDEAERIRRTFHSHDVAAEVRAVRSGQMGRAVQEGLHGPFDAIVVGGGDGTLNAVASLLAGGCKPMGVLPLGTHNHFAKDLGMPLVLEDAVGAITRGSVQPLDVAEVNGRIFLNFSGIGFHPHLIRRRQAQRQAHDLRGMAGKFWAMGLALVDVLQRPPLLRVRLSTPEVGGWGTRRVTSSIIVCNNPHQMRVFGLESVSQLDRSTLNLYIAKATGTVALARLLLSAAFRRLHMARDFESLVLPEFRIDLPRRRVMVSIDGEVLDLPTPLHYRIRRSGLKVIMPG